MGPVLLFRGARAAEWDLAVITVASADDPLGATRLPTGVEAAPVTLARHRDLDIVRYDFALPLAAEGQGYTLAGRFWPVHLPRPGARPRIAYTACNGIPFEDAVGGDPARNERWRHLAGEHARDPFHLLLQGGDQLYADTIWREVPELNDWQDLAAEERRARPFAAEAERHVTDYYVDRYLELWSQPDLVPLMAAVPSLMMWDDHDIFDGWGSYEDEEQASPVYQGIWRAARRAFALFQLGADPGDLPAGFGDARGGHFGWAYAIGEVGIIAPDLRSDRSITQVMGDAAWAWLEQALDRLAGCRHVLLMSSVPIMHADLALLERVTVLERLLSRLSAISGFRDDLRDQWQSLGHKAEWRRIVGLLIDFSARSGARVTVLSGEVHVAALGLIEGRDVAVTQLTSSAIVSPVPPLALCGLFELMSLGTTTVAPGIRARMLPLPGRKRRFLRDRNWLALDVEPDGGMAVAWYAEDVAEPIRLAIPARG